MPVTIDILDFRCFNQLRNGENFDQNLSEFTPNLVGNVGEKVRVTYNANISQTAFTEGVESWLLVDLGSNTVEVTRSSGSFIADSVQVGDTFIYYNNWERRKQPGFSQGAVVNATVDFLSTEGDVMRFTIDSYIAPFNDLIDGGADKVSNVGMVFDQRATENLNTAIFAKFGLIGDDETFNFQSKTTESQQVYYRGEIPLGSSDLSGESLGKIKDWVTGQMSFGLSASDPDFFSAQYTVTHDFIINPFYTIAFREFIDNNTVPELLEGDNSLKYAVELDLRKTLSNTGSSKSSVFSSLLGFTGWYGENFNGLNRKYQISSVTYEDASTTDPFEGININASTKAIITIDQIGADITDYSCGVYLIRVPNSEDEYIGTETDLIENFIYKSEIVSSPATSTPNVTTSIVSGDLVIEYTIDYTTSEKLRLSTDDEFMLFVQIEDPTILAGNSDRVVLIADLKNYVDIDYISQFINVPQYNFLQHGQSIGDTGLATPRVSNEDGILLDGVFGVNTVRNAVVNTITIDLLAFNSSLNRSFSLDTYSFNIGDPVFSGGIQQIIIDSIRGYPLPEDDEFNQVSITTESQNGDYREYNLRFGQKITWQDWIFNPDVDSVFFDSSQPNNNLNEKSSNYSGLEGYEIKVALIINVTGEDDLGRTLTGDFIHYGGDLTVDDYDESEDAVTGVIQTFDLETGNSLEGNILYNGKDTLFRAVFQNASEMQFGIHRIEPSQNQGDGILEFSSIVPSFSPNLLKPVDGETLLKFDLVGSELTTECLIDGGLVEEGVSYKLSARAGNIIIPPYDFVRALQYDGVDSFVSWAGSEYSLGNEYTAYFWVQIDNIGEIVQGGINPEPGNILFAQNPDGGGTGSFAFEAGFQESTTSGFNKLQTSVGGGGPTFATTHEVPDDWAGTILLVQRVTRKEGTTGNNSCTSQLYGKGELGSPDLNDFSTITIGSSETLVNNPVRIASRTNAVNVLDGQMLEFGVFNRELSLGEIAILWNSGNGSDPTQLGTLIHQWLFDETDPSSTASDIGTQGNDLTLNNFPASPRWVTPMF